MVLQIRTKVLNSYNLCINDLTYIKHVFPIFLNPGGGPAFLDALLVIETVEDCIEKLL